MGLFALYITNSAGSLIYQRNLDPTIPKLPDNDYIRAASTFHTLNAMSKQAAPIASGGIETLYTDTFALKCLHTSTCFTFFITADRRAPDSDLNEVLSAIYMHFADYVQKNPFYTEGQRVKVEKFDDQVTTLYGRFVQHFKTHYKH